MTDASRILKAAEEGDPQAAGQLLPLVYDELRRLAAQKLAREPSGQTLDATSLVHAAYLRLVGEDVKRPWQGRAHFIGAASQAMRRILIENARRKKRLKRGGDMKREALSEAHLAEEAANDRLLAVDEALETLAKEDEQAAEVVKLRYFVGLSIEQSAEALGISVSTANRRWRFARAWLYRHLNTSA
jgi:RNA polymerase sigma factor (TIGR02999 family)